MVSYGFSMFLSRLSVFFYIILFALLNSLSLFFWSPEFPIGIPVIAQTVVALLPVTERAPFNRSSLGERHRPKAK